MQGAFWIFACYDNNRVSAMSTFDNNSRYYSMEHAIATARNLFSIPDYQPVVYVYPNDWNAPNITATEASFNVDLPTINNSIIKYLELKGYNNQDILKALDVSSAIPTPNLGILLCCIDLRNTETRVQTAQPVSYKRQYQYTPYENQQKQIAKSHPIRSLWASLIVFAITAIILISLAPNNNTIIMQYLVTSYSFLIFASMGCAIFLMLQKGVKYKVFASFGYVLCCILTFINLDFDGVNGINISRMIADLADISRLITNLIPFIVTISLGILCLFIIRNGKDSKPRIIAWICGGGIFISYMVIWLPILTQMPPQGFIYTILGGILRAGCMIITIYLLNTLCTMKTLLIDISTGALIWLIISITATTLITFLQLGSVTFHLVLIIYQLLACIGYLLLLCKARPGFLLSLFSIGISILVNIDISILYGSAAFLLSSLLGVINPAITWALIEKAWRGDKYQFIPCTPYKYQ